MSNQITSQNKPAELKEVVSQYLSGVQTKSGQKPSEAQFDNFLNFCVANKLNPFKKQAYLVGYDSKNGPVFSEITGINGYRSIAHRTGTYTGRSQTEWGKTQNNDLFATVTAYRSILGEDRAFTATVFYSESVQTDFNGKPNTIWSKRPKGQLDKCAEAAALRMAFPEELGETYIEDEFDVQAVEGREVKKDESQTVDVQVKSELQKFIEEEAQSLEALMAVEKSINTEEEQLAYDRKFEQLNKPTTSDGALMEEERSKTNV
jgi:phage recombination protein Bet